MITIRFTSVDGGNWKRNYPDADKARAAVTKQLGPCEFGSSYAISYDGICKAQVESGGMTIRELMREQT